MTIFAYFSIRAALTWDMSNWDCMFSQLISAAKHVHGMDNERDPPCTVGISGETYVLAMQVPSTHTCKYCRGE